MTDKLFTVYKIIYKPTGNICYIGQTDQSLNNRFIKHCINKNDSLITAYINKRGRYNFEILPIATNLTNVEANDLEKKMIRKMGREYKLYNKQLYTDKYVPDKIGSKYDSSKNNPNIRKIRCITTGEIFNNCNDARRRYHIASSSLFNALNNPVNSAGFDDDDNPLHWEYTDGKIKQIEEAKYKVYIISQKQNDTFVPIYVGMTIMALKRRFAAHYTNKSGALYDVLNTNNKDDFKIEEYKNFNTKEETIKCEEELTIQLQQRYKLYNRYIGTQVSEQHKYNHKKHMIARTKEQLQLGVPITGSKPCLCINDKKIYYAIHDASKKYKLDRDVIHKSCDDQFYNCNGKFFQWINPYKEPIKTRTYTLYALVYHHSIKFIFYSKYTILNIDEAIQNSKYYNDIQKIVEEFSIKQVSCKVLCHNIATAKEAEDMRKTFLNALKNYSNRKIAYNIDQSINPGKIICLDTGEYFKTANQVTQKYNVPKTVLKRVLNGYVPGVLSKVLNKLLHFKYENDICVFPYAGMLNLYYVLYDKKPVAVIITKAMPSDILPSLKTCKRRTLYYNMQELDYNKFSLSIVHTGITDMATGKLLKQMHINLLYALNYELFTDLI